ncbi:MAG: hypothetical protein KF760_13720 [Candidatus Eremiobacteraeota bacterium]|nr:hypothetical protein [Candidatus Eremiobacteraeota bacterium]MCW5867774.1 hypothetical protein [Candidatus Eremiobacteraeota bacterium]
MSATTENKAEFHCSCGRTFAHEISLKRHCWVTGHTADNVEPHPPSAAPAAPVAEVTPVVIAPVELPTIAPVNVVDEAVRILREKQQAQHAFEVRQARERQVRQVLDQASAVVQQGMQKAAETSRQGAEVVRQSTVLALRLLLVVLVCGGMLVTGMGVGRLLASPADAEAPAVPVSVERQLVGHQAQ